MTKGKRKNNTVVHTVRGHAQLGAAMSAASAVSGFVVTKWQVDTTLCTTWTTLGQSFAKWRIRKLRFTYVPIYGSTTVGVVGICYLPDPNSSNPSSTLYCTTIEDSTMDSIWHKQNLTVSTLPKQWLFTRDGVATTDDRLEMFGNVYAWSDLTVAANIPGIMMMYFEVDFMDMANSTVLPSPQSLSVKKDLPDDVVELAQKLLKIKDKSKIDSNG